jgi:1-acyl-sn-glycerol-3-phosphate acyltransferase
MLRLTAKATQFGHKTFTSWLIESAGTVPIKRRKDSPDEGVDNTDAMLKLMQVCLSVILFVSFRQYHFVKALETGDAVCLFPEGMSRYHPTIAPLKTGGQYLIL